jgi:hypothetical protein
MISSNADEFAARIMRAAKELTNGSTKGVAAAALTYTTAIRSNISRDTGGTNRLRGVGRRGAAVGAGFRLKGSVGPKPSALVSARGPLQLLERDTKPHSMAATRGARGRANKRKGATMTVGAGHPGTKGKHPFERGVVAATPAANKLLGESIVASVRSVLR